MLLFLSKLHSLSGGKYRKLVESLLYAFVFKPFVINWFQESGTKTHLVEECKNLIFHVPFNTLYLVSVLCWSAPCILCLEVCNMCRRADRKGMTNLRPAHHGFLSELL